jgi:hypothetical protein
MRRLSGRSELTYWIAFTADRLNSARELHHDVAKLRQFRGLVTPTASRLRRAVCSPACPASRSPRHSMSTPQHRGRASTFRLTKTRAAVRAISSAPSMGRSTYDRPRPPLVLSHPIRRSTVANDPARAWRRVLESDRRELDDIGHRLKRPRRGGLHSVRACRAENHSASVWSRSHRRAWAHARRGRCAG